MSNLDEGRKRYLTVDEISEFLTKIGYSTSKPSLVKQQMYGVTMRSLPEKDLLAWSRDTRKRLYHPFTVYESIVASMLFAGRYWHGLHAARLVHFDVFTGRLGYYSENFLKLNKEYKIHQQVDNRESVFTFSLNDVFRQLIQESDFFIIKQDNRKESTLKIEIVARKYTPFNSNYDEKLLQTYYKDYTGFSNMFFVNNEMRMVQNDLDNVYNNLLRAACSRIFSRGREERYMEYQTMLYTQAMEDVIHKYESQLTDYMANR